MCRHIFENRKKYLSDDLPANKIMSIDKTFLETYDNSVPRYNFRFQPIYTAWKCYTFLLRDIQRIMKPDHEDF